MNGPWTSFAIAVTEDRWTRTRSLTGSSACYPPPGPPAPRGLHDVRHGVGTVLLSEGVHPAIASAVLGHSSPAFIMTVYQHVLPGMTAKPAEAREI
jgi:integrase